MARAEFDPYAVLGVAPTAEPEAIARAYRALAHRYHPDRNPGDAESAERMKAVNVAHDLLRDRARRRAHHPEARGASPDAVRRSGGPRGEERRAEERRAETSTRTAQAPPPPPARTIPRDRAVGPAGHEVAGPALWVVGLAGLTVLLWGRLGPNAPLVAAVLVLGLLGTARTVVWMRSRPGEGPAELLLLFGWPGAWSAVLLFLPLLPLVGLLSACATLARLVVRPRREKVS